VTRLKEIANQFLDHVYAMDAAFISDATLDELPRPSFLGKTKIGGIDINKPRIRTVFSAALSLACAPRGFTVADFATTVRSMSDSTLLHYHARRAAYDLKKLRAKNLLTKLGNSHRYSIPSERSRYSRIGQEGKPRSFFLCFVKIFKKVVAFGVTRAADPRAWTGWVRRRVDRLSENDASSSATRKWLLLTSKSEMLTSKSLFLIADVEPRNCR